MTETKNYTPEELEQLNYTEEERKQLDAMREKAEDERISRIMTISEQWGYSDVYNCMSYLAEEIRIAKSHKEDMEEGYTFMDYKPLCSELKHILNETDTQMHMIENRLYLARDFLNTMKRNQFAILTGKDEFLEEECEMFSCDVVTAQREIERCYKVLTVLNEFKAKIRNVRDELLKEED